MLAALRGRRATSHPYCRAIRPSPVVPAPHAIPRSTEPSTCRPCSLPHPPGPALRSLVLGHCAWNLDLPSSNCTDARMPDSKADETVQRSQFSIMSASRRHGAAHSLQDDVYEVASPARMTPCSVVKKAGMYSWRCATSAEAQLMVSNSSKIPATRSISAIHGLKGKSRA